MNDRLEFTVGGIPVQQGSMIARLIKGRPVVVHQDGPSLKVWRRSVATAAKAHMAFRRPWGPQVPVAVTVLFAMPRGKTVTRPRPSVPPDIDKLTRAVLDALTEAGVYADDGQVVDLYAHEIYSPTPGVRVLVRDANLDATTR